jgi:hypothetical protein
MVTNADTAPRTDEMITDIGRAVVRRCAARQRRLELFREADTLTTQLRRIAWHAYPQDIEGLRNSLVELSSIHSNIDIAINNGGLERLRILVEEYAALARTVLDITEQLQALGAE